MYAPPSSAAGGFVRRRFATFLVLSLLAIAAAVPGVGYAGQTGKPIESGIVITVDAGSAYRPGEMVEIHLFVTDNGSLVVPTWPGGFPHVHPPNLAERGTVNMTTGDISGGVIALPTPIQFGHPGAYRTFLEAPDVVGLYAIHAGAIVNDVLAFGFGSFQVVDAELLVSVEVGAVYQPNDTVEVHIFVTLNGALVDPVLPAGFPHLHPPDFPQTPLITLSPLQQFGHPGAYRTSITAPSVIGLYAVHAAATVGNTTAFGFGQFLVVEAPSEPPGPIDTEPLLAASSMATIWALAAFGVSIVVLILAVVILVRQRGGA